MRRLENGLYGRSDLSDNTYRRKHRSHEKLKQHPGSLPERWKTARTVTGIQHRTLQFSRATKGYVNPEYLQSVGNFLNSLKERTYSCMQAKAGDKVLDVGCGSGIDTIALSRIVGSTGQVFGVDYDDKMVAESERHAEKEGVSAWET